MKQALADAAVFMLILWTVFFGATMVYSTYEIQDLEQHIQVLEEYIEDNGLPTPANPQGEPCPTKPIEIVVDC